MTQLRYHFLLQCQLYRPTLCHNRFILVTDIILSGQDLELLGVIAEHSHMEVLTEHPGMLVGQTHGDTWVTHFLCGIILIKAIPANFLVYFMFLCRCLVALIKHIDLEGPFNPPSP